MFNAGGVGGRGKPEVARTGNETESKLLRKKKKRIDGTGSWVWRLREKKWVRWLWNVKPTTGLALKSSTVTGMEKGAQYSICEI